MKKEIKHFWLCWVITIFFVSCVDRYLPSEGDEDIEPLDDTSVVDNLPLVDHVHEYEEVPDQTDVEQVNDSDSENIVTEGLQGIYFDDISLYNEVLRRVDSSVDFDWEKSSPAEEIPVDGFSVRWIGSVRPDYSETYTFITASDDGVRLWIDNNLVIDDWNNHGVKENEATVELEAGKLHAIKLEYYENIGGASVKLSWKSSRQALEVIPSSHLFTQYDLCPDDPEKIEPGQCGCGKEEGTCNSASNISSDINWFVGNTEAGEWIEYKKVWIAEGHYRFTTHVHAEKENQKIQFEINGSPLNTAVVVPKTDTFTLVHLGSMYLTEGYYDLRLKFVTGYVNCDMFFVKKDSRTTTEVLETDIEYTAAPLDDGMMIVPIGAHNLGTGEWINVGLDTHPYLDANGNLYSEEQILGWYKQQFNVYSPRNSDQTMDMWVAELVAAKPDFIFMHGRGTSYFGDEIEDRDYKYSVGSMSSPLLKRFVDAVDRSQYAKGNIRLAYFQDNVSYAIIYNKDTGKTMSWGDSDFMQYTWKHWFKPWYDTIPREMLYQVEPGKVPIQLWTANLSDYDNSGSNHQIKEFLEFIEAKMIETYNLKPLWVLRDKFFDRDPRTESMSWGYESWFTWKGGCTQATDFNGTSWAFAVNGKRYGIRNCFLNDWNPDTGNGTVPSGGSTTDYKVSALLPDGTPMLRDFYQSSRDAGAKWIVLESWSDMSEGTAFYRSDHEEWLYPNQHLALVREFADRSTESLVFEAEACDEFYDLSAGNSGGEYRYHWHTDREVDLDIYRPPHKMSEIKQIGNPGSEIKSLSVGFQDVWFINADNKLISSEVDGIPVEWKSVNNNGTFKDISLGRYFVWTIDTSGKTWRAIIKQGLDHWDSRFWTEISGGKTMKDIDINWTTGWGIDIAGNVYSKGLKGDGAWKQKPGVTLDSITVDDAFIIGFNKAGELLVSRTEGTNSWQIIPNPHSVTSIDAGGGELWGLNDSGELFRTSSSGQATWKLVAQDVATFSVGWEYAWFIDSSGTAYKIELKGFTKEILFDTFK